MTSFILFSSIMERYIRPCGLRFLAITQKYKKLSKIYRAHTPWSLVLWNSIPPKKVILIYFEKPQSINCLQVLEWRFSKPKSEKWCSSGRLLFDDLPFILSLFFSGNKSSLYPSLLTMIFQLENFGKQTLYQVYTMANVDFFFRSYYQSMHADGCVWALLSHYVSQ